MKDGESIVLDPSAAPRRQQSWPRAGSPCTPLCTEWAQFELTAPHCGLRINPASSGTGVCPSPPEPAGLALPARLVLRGGAGSHKHPEQTQLAPAPPVLRDLSNEDIRSGCRRSPGARCSARFSSSDFSTAFSASWEASGCKQDIT